MGRTGRFADRPAKVRQARSGALIGHLLPLAAEAMLAGTPERSGKPAAPDPVSLG